MNALMHTHKINATQEDVIQTFHPQYTVFLQWQRYAHAAVALIDAS